MYYHGILLEGRRKNHEKPQSAQVVSCHRFEQNTSRHYSGIFRETEEKPRKTSVGTGGVLPEIRTEYLPNNSPERYRYTAPLSATRSHAIAPLRLVLRKKKKPWPYIFVHSALTITIVQAVIKRDKYVDSICTRIVLQPGPHCVIAHSHNSRAGVTHMHSNVAR
jgi:hypothetical protein